jgi:transposase
MNTTRIKIETTGGLPVPAPVAWIGLDWGHRENAFALQEGTGPVEAGTVAQSAEALHPWLRGLAERFGGRQVAVGVETSRGAIVSVLLQYSWITIYPIHPATSARYRKAFTPSGASDDGPDARVLLDLVHQHANKLRPLQPNDSRTEKLLGLVELRRDIVNRRSQVVCQLTSLLRSYYPQALELVTDLDTELALDFLKRWPDLITLKAAKRRTIKRFYHAHNLRRPELLEERLKFIDRAVALTTQESLVSVSVLHLRCLLDQLRTLREHVAILDKEAQVAFAEHPEAYLFRELPGAGPALAPRLCVIFGEDRGLYPDSTSLQKLSGVAPVVERSGGSQWTHWRYLAPVFTRQSLIEWAGQTVVYSEWAGAYYQCMKAKGKRHWAILRALAFKWLRILWKCWQTRTPYDEARYLEQLKRRKSPYAVAP